MSKINFYNRAILPAECVGNGWKLYNQRFWLFFGISALTFFVSNFIPVVNFFVFGIMMCGVYFCFLKSLSGTQVSFEDLFKSFNNFVPALLVGLLYSTADIGFQILNTSSNLMKIFLLGNREPDFEVTQNGQLTLAAIGAIVLLIVTILMIVGGWIIKIFLFFALPLIAEHNLATMDAIRLSANAARKNFFGIVLLLLFQLLIVIGGFLLCCIGVFLVIPIVYGSSVFAYRQAFPKFGISK